jgi:two-component system chemotaxis response regulator CheY
MTYKFENITVLIVDSQPAIVDLIKSVLKMFGVKDVLTSTDAETGLKTFKGRKPDLLIVDWDLDDINGLAFIKAIRHDPVNPHVPIIFTTALSSAKRVAQARDSGITEFLRKPFTAEALFKRIEAIVEKPRDFVLSEDFTGPDRRRKSDKDFKGEEKRGKWFIDDEN